MTHEPRLVVGGAAVGAARRVALPESPVELRQFPQLHAAEVVLSLGHLHTLTDHLLDLRTERRRASGTGRGVHTC